MPELINYMLAWKTDISGKEAKKGFRMLFSGNPFPKYHMKLDWTGADMGGNWYYSEEADDKGWLCPALYHYFTEAPSRAQQCRRQTPTAHRAN